MVVIYTVQPKWRFPVITTLWAMRMCLAASHLLDTQCVSGWVSGVTPTCAEVYCYYLAGELLWLSVREYFCFAIWVLQLLAFWATESPLSIAK